MDLRIMRDELRKTDDGYELMIYLSSDETEFAKELGRDGNNDRVLEEDVRQYVQKKYPNMKVNVARLMLGGLLLTSVPLATTGMAAAAAPNDYQQTSDWAKAAVQRLTDQKVITGDEAGNFNPQSTMDRDAFVTMLVRALNLKTVTPDTPTFKDVSKDNWAYKYVETAYANGLIKGDTATTFAPGDKVTREQMSTIFVRALGLTPDDIKGQGDDLAFADRASIATYARDSVGFAVKNNLLKGVENNRFAGGDVATREQVAVLADRFLTNHDALVTAAGELKAPTMTASMEKNNLDTILLTFNKAVDNLKAENITVAGPNGEKINVTGVTLGADKKTATVKTDRLTAGLGYTVTVKTDKINRSDAVTPESDVVTVADATALNLKQVSVTFSGKVDRGTAETPSNYQIGGAAANPASATLLPDGKTVLLVLADNQIPGNQEDRDITVQNVKDANGAVVTTATKSVHFLDTTVPKAMGVTTVGPNLFRIAFSEPVKQAQDSDFQLDNGTYSVSVQDVDPINNSVTVRTAVDLTEGGHSLLINSTRGNTPTTQDYAGFKVQETTLNFDYAKDTAAPAIASMTANDPSTVTVKFSKPVKVDTVTKANFYHTYAGYNPDKVDASNPVNGLADTFVLSFSSHLLPPGNVTVHTLQGAEGAQIKDAWGNVFAQADATTTVAVTQDMTKPTVASIVSKTDHTVQLTFSKAVVQSDAENTANYVFKDATGNTANFPGLDADGHPTGGSPHYDPATKTVTFTFDNAIAGGSYKVTAANIKDEAMQANTMDEATLSFSVNDATPPTISNVTLEGTRQVVVSFSEPMKTGGTGSILDATNYQLANAALPTGTTITAGAGSKSAIINLPTGATVNAGTQLSIGHVADAAGNYTAALGEDRTIAAATGATVIGGRVQSTDTRKITVEVNQPLQSITTVGFGWSGGNVVGTSYTNTKVGPNKEFDGAVITLTVDKDINKADPGTISINNATGTKNTFGTQIANTTDPVAVSDKLAPFVDTTKNGGYVFQNATTIVLNMSEGMNPKTFAAEGNNGFSVSLGNVTGATYNATNNQIVITGTGFTTNTKVSYNGTNGIKDTNGNLLGAFANQALKTAPAQ